MADVNGTAGNDVLRGTSGNDAITAGAGYDTIYGSSGTDTVTGGTQDDSLNYLFGTPADSPGLVASIPGNRTLTIGAAGVSDSAGQIATSFSSIETVSLGLSTVAFTSFATGTTTIDASGLTAAPVANGVYSFILSAALNTGNTVVTGSSGRDYVALGLGSHQVDGGAGIDLLSMGYYGNITAKEDNGLVTISAAGGVTTARNFEELSLHFIGGIGTLDASTVKTRITFGATDGITLIGGAGDDLFDNSYLIARARGPSYFTGGAGADTYRYASFGGNFDQDHILDFAAADRIDLSYAAVFGRNTTFSGANAFSGVANQVRYEASNGKTQVQIDENGDGLADSTLFIDNGAFQLEQTAPGSNVLRIAQANVITGTDRGEVFRGTIGDDLVDAKGGNDTFYLSSGTDTVAGGAGRDTLVLYPAELDLFGQAPDGPVTYTISATRATGSNGLLDTTLSSFERLFLTDANGLGATVDARDFSGSATINLRAGLNNVIGTAFDDDISVYTNDLATIDAGAGFDSVTLRLYTNPGAAVVTESDGIVTAVQNGAIVAEVRNAETFFLFGSTVNASALTIDAVLAGDALIEDVLIGGLGNDILSLENSGEIDLLTGGAGADSYSVSYLPEFGTGTHITDFADDDTVDFAYAALVSDFPIDFIGTEAFTGVAGQYRYVAAGGKTVVEADSDGDGVADGRLTIDNGAFVLKETSAGSHILQIDTTAAPPTNPVPLGAISSSSSSETLTGTAGKDLFFFDNASESGLGSDVIRNFERGDRIVTTAKLPDPNNDGRVRFDHSDHLDYGSAGGPVETLKVFHGDQKATSTLILVDVVHSGDTDYYVYAGAGDTVTGSDLLFG